VLRNELKTVKTTTQEARQFGLTVGIFLLVIAGFLFWKERPKFSYFAYVGGGLAFVGLVVPILLKPIYKVWMSFAVVMGFVMTRVILTILYFGLFTPIALIAKLLDKDLLDERWNRNATTYWKKRPAITFDPKSAENMF
jgi:hypothetical protein